MHFFDVLDLKRTRVLTVCIALALLASVPSAHSQGCVAARGAGSCVNPLAGSGEDAGNGFTGSVSYRWFKSDRHYVGENYQAIRDQRGDQVINNSSFLDTAVTYDFNPRWSASLTIPFVEHDRSSTVKDPTIPNPIDPRGTIIERYHTQSSGLADLRLMANAWIFNPPTHANSNLRLGLGLVIPTGDRNAQDTFSVYDATATGKIRAVKRAVDQSIQPGAGGWGIALDLYGYHKILPRLNAFVNGGYTFTPQEKYRPLLGTQDYSITDNYFGRGGFEYTVWPKQGLTFSLGGRIEGVPVNDFSGGSEGFRRPGYAISIEPGVMVSHRSWSLSVYAPVAVDRNRQRSKLDRINGSAGGDAAFSDYSILASISKRF